MAKTLTNNRLIPFNIEGVTYTASSDGANRITLTVEPANTILKTNSTISFISPITNTGNTVLRIGSDTFKTVLDSSGQPLKANAIKNTCPTIVMFNGTAFKLLETGSTTIAGNGLLNNNGTFEVDFIDQNYVDEIFANQGNSNNNIVAELKKNYINKNEIVNTFDGGLDKVMSAEIGKNLYFSQTPIGSIEAFAGENIPLGWRLCDGTPLTKGEYIDLFNIIGYTYGGFGDTFNLPDLRGLFIRGMDRQRGMDSDFSRALGSFQSDTLQDHWHSLDARSSDAAHIHNGDHTDGVARLNGGHIDKSFGSCLTSESASFRHVGSYENAKANDVRFSEETRTKNLALNYIIKVANFVHTGGTMEVMTDMHNRIENNANKILDMSLLIDGYIQDVKTKRVGMYYKDRNQSGLFLCIANTDSVVNVTTNFRKYIEYEILQQVSGSENYIVYRDVKGIHITGRVSIANETEEISGISYYKRTILLPPNLPELQNYKTASAVAGYDWKPSGTTEIFQEFTANTIQLQSDKIIIYGRTIGSRYFNVSYYI